LLFRCRVTALLLIAAPFLVPGAWRLIGVIPGIVIFAGGLEYLSGSLIAALCFGVPAVLGFPIEGFGSFVLGVFGAAGGLYWFLRYSEFWLTVMAVGSLLFVFSNSWAYPNWFQLDHLVSILLGILIGKLI